MSLRFEAGGGVPPQSHEVLRIEPDGDGRYLTGMPWPAQPPFDEIGVYAARADFERLRELAQAVLAAPPARAGHADAGGESIELDGATASWGPRERSPAAQALVDAVRAAITDARDRPLAVVRAEPAGTGGLVLHNRGERALAVAAGELHLGWGAADRVPSPLRLAGPDPTPFAFPDALAPGATVELTLPDAAAGRGGGLRDALRAGQPALAPGGPRRAGRARRLDDLRTACRFRHGPFVIGSEGGERRRQETGGQPCGTCCSSTPTRTSTAV